jgi:hypothetical protein
LDGRLIDSHRELEWVTPCYVNSRNGVRPLDQESAARLRDALEAEGIEFLDIGSGEGVRLRHCNGEAVDFTNGVEPGVKGNGAK